MEYKIMIPVDTIVSTNARLIYQRGVARLSNEARDEKRQLYEYLKSNTSQSTFEQFKNKYLAVTLIFFIKKSFNMRDLDNMLKTSIDGIFKYTGLNDNKIISIITSKRYVKDSNSEFIYFKLTEFPESKINFELKDILQSVDNNGDLNEHNNSETEVSDK